MTEQEFIDYPHKSRAAVTLANCLKTGIRDIPSIFTLIDKAYKEGRHRPPSYIKNRKANIIEFAEKNGFKLE